MALTLIGSAGKAFGNDSIAFGVSSSYALAAVGPPPVTVPEPYLRFATVGPNPTVITRSGSTPTSLVTGMTTAQGRQFTGWYNVQAPNEPLLGGTQVLACGRGSYVEMDTVFPDEAFNASARTFISCVRLPMGINREWKGYGNLQPLGAFDAVSLLANAASANYGVGIHQIGNDGILPQIPPRDGYDFIAITYDPTLGMGASGPGRLTISNDVSTAFLDIGPLKTGLQGNRRPFRLGYGTAEALGFEGVVYYAFEEVHLGVALSPAQVQQVATIWKPRLGYVN